MNIINGLRFISIFCGVIVFCYGVVTKDLLWIVVGGFILVLNKE